MKRNWVFAWPLFCRHFPSRVYCTGPRLKFNGCINSTLEAIAPSQKWVRIRCIVVSNVQVWIKLPSWVREGNDYMQIYKWCTLLYFDSNMTLCVYPLQLHIQTSHTRSAKSFGQHCDTFSPVLVSLPILCSWRGLVSKILLSTSRWALQFVHCTSANFNLRKI